MSLQTTYQRFLAAPKASALAESASLHYVTTATSVTCADAIVKYLEKEGKQLKKRVEKVLAAVETAESLVLEVETEIEFVSSGGNYLPGLDEQFLYDQKAVLPIVHIVNFENGQIKQARLYWDQSTVLKQIGVIGRSGRNWPVKDGREQCKFLSKSVAEQPAPTPASAPAPAPARPAQQKTQNGNGATNISPKRPPPNGQSTHVMRDPHASLHLFDEEEEETARPIAPRSRSSFKPPPRDLAAIIGAPDDDEFQPVKVLPPKARSSFSKGQTFTLGDEEDQDPTPKVREKTVNVNPKKYAHFEFGNGEDADDAQDPASKTREKTVNVNSKKYAHFEFGNGEDADDAQVRSAKKNFHAKHGSSWAFEDFVTPEKRQVKPRRDDVRHFGWSDDDEEPSPVKQPRKLIPRKDAESHFSLRDEPDTPGAPLGNISNNNNNNNNNNNPRRDNVSQFEISDESPAGGAQKKKEVNPSRQAVVKMMNAHWDHGDEENEEEGEGEEEEDGFMAGMGKSIKETGIRIAGNGQGQRKGLATQESAAPAAPVNRPIRNQNMRSSGWGF